ncbi:hypothetical protein KKHLCK_11920 [Candidatus Electrothrix laxa]
MAMHDFLYIVKDDILQCIIQLANLSRCGPLGNEKTLYF